MMRQHYAVKTAILVVSLALSVAGGRASLAAAQTPGVAAPSEQKTLAATINVYVFPADGQVAEQQNRHEAGYYAWAVSNTKSDPFDLIKQAESPHVQRAGELRLSPR